MVYVIKASGEKEQFDKNKIYQTCFRAGASQKNALRIADEAEQEIYEGISTKKILKIVLKKLDKVGSKESAIRYNIRDSLSKLGGEEFEKYVEHLLRAHGYTTKWNVILKGQYVEHQIDVIAERNSDRYIIECKHHFNPHRFTGLQDALGLWATFEDLKNGGHDITRAWLVSSTKLSDHAIQYGIGKRMWLTSWDYPEKNALRSWISEKGLYPLTSLNLSPILRAKLMLADILLVKELAGDNLPQISYKARIPLKTLNQISYQARLLLNTK